MIKLAISTITVEARRPELPTTRRITLRTEGELEQAIKAGKAIKEGIFVKDGNEFHYYYIEVPIEELIKVAL